MTTYRFQEVERKQVHKLKCRTCGKRFQRTKAVSQTINPFNKNADGQPKTHREIWAELGEELAAMPTPDDLCAKCAAALVADFNAAHPVGTPVRITGDDGTTEDGTTDTEAFMSAARVARVRVLSAGGERYSAPLADVEPIGAAAEAGA